MNPLFGHLNNGGSFYYGKTYKKQKIEICEKRKQDFIVPREREYNLEKIIGIIRKFI